MKNNLKPNQNEKKIEENLIKMGKTRLNPYWLNKAIKCNILNNKTSFIGRTSLKITIKSQYFLPSIAVEMRMKTEMLIVYSGRCRSFKRAQDELFFQLYQTNLMASRLLALNCKHSMHLTQFNTYCETQWTDMKASKRDRMNETTERCAR